MEAQKKAESRARIVRAGIFVGVVVLLVGGAAFVASRNNDTKVDTAGTPPNMPGSSYPYGTTPDGAPITAAPTGTTPDGAPITATPTTTAPSATPAAPPPGSSIPAGTPTSCPAADGNAPRVTKFAQAPPLCIDANKKYTATITTDKGPIVMDLDTKAAPNTVNNFVVLSRYHFYDGVPFHRVLRGFMAQTGDAVGTPLGTGNPGYKIDDELPKEPYKAGDVAMANSGPNTNGSQFFIYTGPNPLEKNYSLFGHVTAGMDTTLKAIMDGGSDTDGAPLTNPSKITTVTITES